MSKKRTHEEYLELVKTNNPNISVIGTYITKNTPITHLCNKHNIYWDTTPERILKGVGCKLCKNERHKQTMCKSHEQYVNEVLLKNPNIKVLGKYDGANTKILHKCLIHNIEWECIPSHILHGGGCKECGIDKSGRSCKKSHEQYLDEVKENNPNITILGIYDGNYVPILHKCNKHNVSWNCSPASILRGSGCYLCAKEKHKTTALKPHNQYIEELNIINPSIEVIEKYNGTNTPILHKCKICGNEWKASPANFLFGCGCPQCILPSSGERIIEKWLKNNNIDYIPQKRFEDCKDQRELPFDFYLTELNKCIEYDGQQHYQPVDFYGGEQAFQNRQLHDKIKTEYCKQNNIPLLRIPYYEKDIETQLEQFIFN